jgi:tetratricopeptide (TPR) repeat protein
MLLANGAQSPAVPLLEKALALEDALPDAQYDLGKILLDSGKPWQSLPHLEAAAKLKPRSRKIHLALAAAYRTMDRKDDYTRELQIMKALLGEDETE